MKTTIDIPKWNKEFETGIETIDLQHKLFLELIHSSHDILEKMDISLAQSHLKEIFFFARFHFCSEENLMRLNDYPGYQHHKELHSEILKEIERRILKFEKAEVSFEYVTSYFIEWFNKHTLNEDMKLGNYLNK